MSDASSEPKGVYHVILFAFAGENSASEAIKTLKKSQKSDQYQLLEWAIVERTDKGKVKVSQRSHKGLGAGIGGGTGLVVGLLGGPLGIAAATIVGAVAGGAIGNYVGHSFDKNDLQKAAAALPPNSSGFVALVEDQGAEALIADMKDVSGSVVTLTVGSELSGALLHMESADVEIADDAPAGDAGASTESTASAATEPTASDSTTTQA